MENVTKRLYEALFLVDSGEAASDWQGINDHVKKIMERNEAEILSIRKWDERPLAYPIMGRKRGTYILVYFNALCVKLSAIERDTQLSERILRVIILRGDHITPEDMAKDTPAILAEKHLIKPVAVEIAAVAAIEEEDDEEVPGIEEQV
ncbi:MAG: 30S ribosomal protein S6 [Sedimentisphaerales bacterium]